MFLTSPNILRFIPEIERERDETFCRVPFAICDLTRRIASVRVVLCPIENVAALADYAELRLSFEIEIESLDGSMESFATQEREIVKSCLGDARSIIIDLVLVCIDLLISGEKPKAIYMVTKARSPPPQALVKHQRIVERLLKLGYRICECGCDPFGRTFWIVDSVAAIA